MAEFRRAPGIFIDGREQKGRTHQRDDGTYASLDLKDVRPGETVTVVTNEGVQELVKAEAPEHDSALSNWRLGERAVQLSLSEPTGAGGTDFIHHGIVMRERLGLRVTYPASEHPNIVYGLGVIASIVSVKLVREPEEQPVAVGLEN
jgi:hypothetical protein